MTDATQVQVQRPRLRGDCLAGGCNQVRPCPWVRCRHHMLWALPERRLRKMSAEELAEHIAALPLSCTLDAADLGGAMLDQVAAWMGLSRQGTRFLEGATRHYVGIGRREVGALAKLKHPSRRKYLEDFRGFEASEPFDYFGGAQI